MNQACALDWCWYGTFHLWPMAGVLLNVMGGGAGGGVWEEWVCGNVCPRAPDAAKYRIMNRRHGVICRPYGT